MYIISFVLIFSALSLTLSHFSHLSQTLSHILAPFFLLSQTLFKTLSPIFVFFLLLSLSLSSFSFFTFLVFQKLFKTISLLSHFSNPFLKFCQNFPAYSSPKHFLKLSPILYPLFLIPQSLSNHSFCLK